MLAALRVPPHNIGSLVVVDVAPVNYGAHIYVCVCVCVEICEYVYIALVHMSFHDRAACTM